MRSTNLFVLGVLAMMAPIGGVTDGGADPVVTGKWSGTFTTDNDLALRPGASSPWPVPAPPGLPLPIALSLAFPDAVVDATQITGAFKITMPVTANGNFTLDKQ